jgi:hypothetical protein
VFSPGGGGGGGGGHSTHTNVALNPLISFARKRWRAVQQKSPTRGRLVSFNYKVLLDVNLAALRCDVCVACKYKAAAAPRYVSFAQTLNRMHIHKLSRITRLKQWHAYPGAHDEAAVRALECCGFKAALVRPLCWAVRLKNLNCFLVLF